MNKLNLGKLKLKDITNILKDIENANSNLFTFGKLLTTLLLIIADMGSVCLSFLFAIFFQNLFYSSISSVNMFDPLALALILLTLPIFPVVYSFSGLYPSYGNDQVKEFRNIAISATVIFVLLIMAIPILQNIPVYPRFTFVLAWFFTLCLTVPLRYLVKKVLSKYDWWGLPVMIIGGGRAGTKVINTLHKQKLLGLRPVIVIDDDVDKWGYIEDVPVVGGLNIIPTLSSKLNIKHAIIAMPKVPSARQMNIVRENSRYFSNLTIIPDMFDSGLWTSTRDLGGLLGLDVQTKLLKKSSQIKKRIFDLILASILLVLSAPIQLLVALLIKLDSRGNVLFVQKRCGIGKKEFDMLKFRSMQIDADERLQEVLKDDEKLREEFEVYHKIDNDPRLTRVGKFIRKYSLDELPQLINVIKGDMSLIGPRAYLQWEVEHLKSDNPIFQVKPGASGLWQVTDRNSSFEERVRIEEYYVRNWSFSLDCILVGKTIVAIIKGTGN